MASTMPILRSGLRRSAIPRRAPFRPTVRYQSTGPSSHTTHVLSGLAGGAVVLAGGYALYSFSSAGRLHSTLNSTAKSAQDYYRSATSQFQQSTPDANEAIEYLRKTAYTYAAFVPGGRGYVDTAFKDLDAVREKHGDKVEEIVKDGYERLQEVVKEVGKAGVSIAALYKVLEVIQHVTTRLANEAGGAMESVMNNHPQIKEKLGGQFEQLKNMGENFGPEAKEKVEEVWGEIGNTLKGGFSAENVNKVKQLVEEKVQELQKYGDKAWDEGLKQIKPYLEKNPKIKQLVEDNADALKQGNVKELWDKVQSGNLDDLKSYVEDVAGKAQKYGEDAWAEVLKRAQPYLDKNPKVKELVEKNADALKKGDAGELFERVKKSVEKGNLDDLKEYVDEAKGKAQEYGQEAWKELLKRAQPYLDKNPKVKKLVEENQDALEKALKKGDASELYDRVKKSVESGKVEDLKGYVEEVTKKSK